MAERSRDTPLAEVNLRKYEKPYALEERELVRKVCLSLGLLQYGDSRDIIVDIFYVLLKFGPIGSQDIEVKVKETRNQYGLPLFGVASSNIRRQVRRLKDAYLVEKFDGTYRVVENAPLVDIFEEHVERFMLQSILGRVKEYLAEVEKLRPKQSAPQADIEKSESVNGLVKRVVLK